MTWDSDTHSAPSLRNGTGSARGAFLIRFAFCLFLQIPAFAEEGEPYPITPATPPADAVDSFELLHGFRLELIAAEPLVTDPVDICYDENGRAYVAEMNDYPYTDKKAHKPSQENPTDAPIGRVRLLEDTDDDGVFDKSTVFVEGLSWPTGVVCWKGGVYITATPDLWYCKDHDGDGVADERRKVYTGFRKYNVQAVMNNPIWGLDNHIYIAGSTNGGAIRKVDDPDAPIIHASRHDFRFDPRTETLELESGYGRFGNTFDDLGNRFVCNIRHPALHIVMPKRLADRNPLLPPFDPREDVCDFGDFIPVHRIAPPEAWRVERAKRWATEEPDRHPETELVGGGAVTSSAGITCYRGDAYPEAFRGNLFVGDASSGVIYRLTLEPTGVTFRADRPDTEADFIASRDIWSRLVNLENSPDGCLTLLDMYREAIEHPWSIPDDIHGRIDLERGRDRGRIYRVVPPGAFERRSPPKLGKMTSEELVPLLAHANAWHRETAQRLLVERGESLPDALVHEIVETANEPGNELGRIHALWTLDGLPGGIQDELFSAIEDESYAVREQGYRILSKYADELAATRQRYHPFLSLAPPETQLTDPELFWMLASMRHASDTRPSIPYWGLGAFAESLRRANEDPWLRRALLCGPVPLLDEIFVHALLSPGGHFAAPFFFELGYAVGAGDDVEELPTILELLETPELKAEIAIAASAGLAAGLKRRRANLFAVAEKAHGSKNFEEHFYELATRTATSPEAPLSIRYHALDLLRNFAFPRVVPTYRTLLQPDTPLELQQAIVGGLASYDRPEIPSLLIDRWSALTPELQQQALEMLLTRPSYLPPLLGALEEKAISPHLLSRTRREFLTHHSDGAIAERAGRILGGRPDRNEVIARYTEAIAGVTPDPGNGQQVYRQFCMACHQKGEEGSSILGPNLATVRDWDRGQLLTNILDPSREVSPAFIEYLVEKEDGTVVGGAILNETEVAVLLRRPDGGRLWVNRNDIHEIRNSGHSLMPDGLEAVIPEQAMADLIAYLKQ